LTDTTTLYHGGRRDAYHHLLTANKHGFNIDICGCPIIIADGLMGDNDVEVEAQEPLKYFDKFYIASDIFKADTFIFISHAKGHMLAGFGGALKNIGVGCASKRGKQALHSGPQKEDGSTENFQEKIAEYAAVVLRNKNASYVNFLNHISAFCDCHGSIKNEPIIADIGVLAGTDPVSVDQASIDLIKANSTNGEEQKIFHGIDPNICLAYAQEIGLGRREYEIIAY
jgi:uncharacterized Fe-S center protein